MIDKCWKGYNPDMTCRGKQYISGETYEEEGGNVCGAGMMHYCKNPWDVLDYYGFVNDQGEINDFTEVEPLAEEKNKGDKYACSKIKIGARIGLKGIVKACIDFTLEKTKTERPDCCSSGDSAKIGSSGDYAKIGSSGDSAQIGSSGYSAKINAEGTDSVIMCAGNKSAVKSKKGNWVTLSEWRYDEVKEREIPLKLKTIYIDGVNYKEDTWYKMVDGKIIEVNRQ